MGKLYVFVALILVFFMEPTKADDSVNVLSIKKEIRYLIDSSKLKNINSMNAVNCSKHAVTLAEEITNPILTYEALDALSDAYLFKGDYDSAIFVLYRLHEKIIEDKDLYSSIEYKKNLTSLLIKIGVAFEEMGFDESAMEYYYRAYKTTEDVGFQAMRSDLLNNFGKICFNKGFDRQAWNFFYKALKINEAKNNKSGMYIGYNNLAAIYEKWGLYDSSLYYCFKSMEIARSEKHYYSLSIVYNNIGTLYKNKENPLLAESYYLMGKELQEENSFNDVLIDTYLSLSRFYMEQGRIKEASQTIEGAKELAVKLKGLQKLKDVHYAEYKHFKKLGDIGKTFAAFESYVEYKDTLYEIKNRKQFLAYQAFYQVEMNMKNNKLMKEKLKVKKSQLKQRGTLLYLSLTALAFMAFAIVALYRKNKFEKRTYKIMQSQKDIILKQERELFRKKEELLKTELDEKNRELTTRSLEISKNNEKLLTLISEIEKIKKDISKASPSQTNRLSKIQLELKRNSDANSWKEFRLYFEKVHPRFYDQLLSKYSFLTINEQKLCAFIKIGLSTKEIANITCKEVRTVEMARLRLRKRLEMSKDESLSCFMSRF